MKIQDFKMKVTPQQSKEVQRVLLKNGCNWMCSRKKIRYTQYPYLYCKEKAIRYGMMEDTFKAESTTELTFDEFKRKYIKKRRYLRLVYCVFP